MRHVARELKWAKDEEWDGKEDGNNYCGEARGNAEQEYQPEECLCSASRKSKEVVRIIKSKQCHKVPVILTEEVEPKLGLKKFLREAKRKECCSRTDTQEREAVLFELFKEAAQKRE